MNPRLNDSVIKELESKGETEPAAVLRPLFHALHSVVVDKLKRFSRVLPIGEYLVDRWDKARLLGFGEGTSVYDSCLIYGDVRVGTNCWIGPFTILDGTGRLEIGNDCTISAGAQIYTHDTVARTLHGSEVERSAVRIGNNVYLAPNVVVARGVTIGDRAVVGANSFVNADVAPGAKVAGNPARVIGAT